MIEEVSSFYATYTKSDSGYYMAINEDLLTAAGANKMDDVVGRKDAELPWAQFAQIYLGNDAQVMQTRKNHIFYEKCLYQGRPQIYRATKAPIIGNTGKVLGIHGVSVLVGERCLISLTKQQTACLKFLALGNTHKQIGDHLGLAQKTVEHYLDTVKTKLRCHSRSELIMQAIERGLIDVL